MTPAHSNRLVYAITLGLLAALGPLCLRWRGTSTPKPPRLS